MHLNFDWRLDDVAISQQAHRMELYLRNLAWRNLRAAGFAIHGMVWHPFSAVEDICASWSELIYLTSFEHFENHEEQVVPRDQTG